MGYAAFKHLHLLTITISVIFFTIRGVSALMGASWIRNKWVRILAHGNDTVLLIAALALCYHLGQWPFYNSAWITAKVLGLLTYIGFGTIAIKRGKLWAYAMALLSVAYIVWVAINKVPFPAL